METKSISQILKDSYTSLSPGQKKVAEFINHNKDEGVLLTAFQLGEKVGVSETTVIRFAYALGFKGYSEMQDVLRKDWLATKEDRDIYVSQKENTFEGFVQVVEKEKAVLNQLLEQMDTKIIWDAVDQLIAAKRIYIGGFGSSYGAAYWFYYALRQYRENVFISSPTGFSLEDIVDLNHESAGVVFSFPRYRREAMELIKCLAKQDVHMIAVSNNQFSAVGQFADITLTTEERENAGHHSIASVVSLLEIIIAGFLERDHKPISIRQQKLEQLYTDQGLFLE
ncbi:MurR/RpiR family transcriptional regulator [Lentibacillus sp. N15]|uniref:MurR/RpiR family transcriptional regulator n=1 Tax=Lentibacillus songyuanensis TaxID=3136161 RepID=UPI0031BB8A2B